MADTPTSEASEQRHASAQKSTPENDDSEVLAERILAAIPKSVGVTFATTTDRERVASDLAGLRRHQPKEFPQRGCQTCPHDYPPCPDAQRYADGLRRTAALYAVRKGTEGNNVWIMNDRLVVSQCGESVLRA